MNLPLRKPPYFAIGYALFYGLIYFGWLCHRSDNPALLGFTWRYWVWLVAAAAGFLVPTLVSLVKKKLGGKRMLFSAVPVAGLFLLVYVGSAWHYYHTQSHYFDPFVQNQPERFESVPKKKDQSVYRILCLGGSTTGNEEVPAVERFPNLLEAKLQKLYPQRRIEVMNAGRAWYTTRHSLINYASYYSQWHPDLIIVMHAMNDLIRSFRHADFALGDYNDMWSHFYGPAIQGARPPSFETHLFRKLKGIGVFKQAAESWYSKFRYLEEEHALTRFRAIHDQSRNLKRLIEIAQYDGATVIVVSQPSLYHPGMTAQEKAILRFQRECCLEKIDRWRFRYPTWESLFKAMAAFNTVNHGVALSQKALFVDAAREMPKDLRYFKDDVHYTPQGGEKMAAILAEAIVKAGLISKIPKPRLEPSRVPPVRR